MRRFCVILLAACGVAPASPVDLWSKGQSNTIITDSDHDVRDYLNQIVGFNEICPLINMFGGAQGCGAITLEDNNALFGDVNSGDPDAGLNWVTWQTASPVTIAHFDLEGRADPELHSVGQGCPEPYTYPMNYCFPRAFDYVELDYWTGSAWQQFYGGGVAPPPSFAAYPNYIPPPNYYEILSADVSMPQAATDFKAVFTDAPWSNPGNGVRILSLEGFGSPSGVPEPSQALPLALAAGAFAVWLARRR